MCVFFRSSCNPKSIHYLPTLSAQPLLLTFLDTVKLSRNLEGTEKLFACILPFPPRHLTYTPTLTISSHPPQFPSSLPLEILLLRALCSSLLHKQI